MEVRRRKATGRCSPKESSLLRVVSENVSRVTEGRRRKNMKKEFFGFLFLSLPKTLRKSFKTQKGQATFEYFLILILFVAATLLGVSTLLPNIRTSLEGSGGLFTEARHRIIDAHM